MVVDGEVRDLLFKAGLACDDDDEMMMRMMAAVDGGGRWRR